MQRGTFQWMKSVNKSIILNKIRVEQPISRAQIAKETRLTPPTVSSIVKELIEQGIVRESEQGESKGGRKPTMLLINSEAFYVVGLDAGPETVDCLLADLSGKVIKRVASRIKKPINRDQFLKVLKNNISKIIQEISEDKEKIIGIGVAMHGVVDIDTGMSLFAPNLSLTKVPIKQELEQEFNLVVKVENDARAMALGEEWFGNHGRLESMLAVNIGRGIGAGLILNGKLYHGAKDIAGEVGHMTVDMNGDICECGNRGCLQAFASGPSIAQRSKRMMQEKQLANPTEIPGEKVYEYAAAGDENFAGILHETGEIIGIGLTNLIHIMNPQKIVLAGGVTNSREFILPAIQKEIEKRALTPDAKKTEVVVSELGDDATLLGAVALLLVELFELK